MVTGVITEEWKRINEYDNYQISNLWRVRNNETGHILKVDVDENDNLCVYLCKDKMITKYALYKLVSREFNIELENCYNYDRKGGLIIHCSYGRYCRRSYNWKSKFFGLSWHRINNTWRVCIYVDGVAKHFGSYIDEKEAAKVYNNYSKLYFGANARLNVIED